MMTKVRLRACGAAHDKDAYGAIIRDVWKEVYRAANIAPGQDITRINDLIILNRKGRRRAARQRSSTQMLELDPRRRDSMTPREMLPAGGVEWCFQTLELLKIRYDRKTLSERNWNETLAELERHRAWETIPPECPYGSEDAMLKAEIGVTKAEGTAALKKQLARVNLILELLPELNAILSHAEIANRSSGLIIEVKGSVQDTSAQAAEIRADVNRAVSLGYELMPKVED